MYRRQKKQIVYGGLFLVIAVLFLYVVISPFIGPLTPNTPVATPTSPYSAIEVEAVDVVQHAANSSGSGRSVDIVARLRNPNANAGVAAYTLTFDVLDAQGKAITSPVVTSYILPGSIQYMMALSVPVGQNVIGTVQVQKPSQAAFVPIPNSLPVPNFSSFSRERSSKTIGSEIVEEQKGIVGNTGTVNWERVEVYGVALDSSGSVVGVGKTFLGSLKVGEQREFTMQWSQPQSATSRVIIFPTTNIFSESNFSKIIGDPASLR